MLRLTITPEQVQDTRVFPMAILATVLGTNPEWLDGRVTYKFDEHGLKCVPDDVINLLIDMEAVVEGIPFWVEVDSNIMSQHVPEGFHSNMCEVEGVILPRKWSDYSQYDVGLNGKHLMSAVHKDCSETFIQPDTAQLQRLKTQFGYLYFNNSEKLWRSTNQAL